jgi:hypothetical protein
MRLFVEPMDCIVVDVTADGLVQIEGEAPRPPTLQERRAIIYAAQKEMDALTDVIDLLQSSSDTGASGR